MRDEEGSNLGRGGRGSVPSSLLNFFNDLASSSSIYVLNPRPSDRQHPLPQQPDGLWEPLFQQSIQILVRCFCGFFSDRRWLAAASQTLAGCRSSRSKMKSSGCWATRL